MGQPWLAGQVNTEMAPLRSPRIWAEISRRAVSSTSTIGACIVVPPRMDRGRAQSGTVDVEASGRVPPQEGLGHLAPARVAHREEQHRVAHRVSIR